MFRGNTISIRFSYFGNPNWTKKPSGNYFVSFDFCLFVFGGSGEWKTRRVRFFECVSYIFFFTFFFRLGIPRARISIVGRTRTGTESGGYCWRRE